MARLVRDLLELDELEVAAGGSLSDEFREFLLRTEQESRGPTFQVGGEQRSVVAYYAIGSADSLRDLAIRRSALRGIVPADLLAFARDDRDDLVCIGVAGGRLGAVYLIPIRRGRGEPARARLLAPNLASFLAPAPSPQSASESGRSGQSP